MVQVLSRCSSVWLSIALGACAPVVGAPSGHILEKREDRITAMAAPVSSADGGVPERHCPKTKVLVTVVNPLPSPRTSASIVIALAEIRGKARFLEPQSTVVFDESSRIVMSQLVDTDGDERPDELLFQADFGASETKAFTLQCSPRRPPARETFKVYGRFARERHDDFAWENDRIAHRMYGPALESWAKEPLTSSGVDVWCKRTPRLVVNDWYMTDRYHEDNGEGADFYSVGKSRGCGGIGIWSSEKLHVSRNFVDSRVLANGPIRLIFELTYAPWDVGRVKVAEKKRITLDAGHRFDRFESTFHVDGDQTRLALAIGIARHEGGAASVDPRDGALVSWETLKKDNGHLGCAVVAPAGEVTDYRQTETDYLLMTATSPRVPSIYFAGFAWDRGGEVVDGTAWSQQVRNFANELAAPLSINLQVRTADPDRNKHRVSSWSSEMCETVMRRFPAGLVDKWEYDLGLVLRGFERAWRRTKNRKYMDYVRRTIDSLVDANGGIRGYVADSYNIDAINEGKVLFAVEGDTPAAKEKERYLRPLRLLRSQMQHQPRTKEGGFWHKGIYPHQMWLDGAYMAAPFLAEFAVRFDESPLLDDVASQILLLEKHLRDPNTGLLSHGWDESLQQRWANPQTGVSSQFWGRGMGWYAMAVVDVLEIMPPNHPARGALREVLQRLATAIARVQDPASGVWWQVLDAGGREKNFREASASAMFVYTVAKAVNLGWLDRGQYEPVVRRGYDGIIDEFVEVDPRGDVNLKSVCRVAGLGGYPYRDGSYAYYTSTEVVPNDPKGVGAFILASLELEQLLRE